MPDPEQTTYLDLSREHRRTVVPVQQLVSLIIEQAVLDHAKSVEFCLIDQTADMGFRVSVRTETAATPPQSMPRQLFSPCMVVLCNHASIPYYRKGLVAGKIKTINPSSEWQLESDDLQKRLLLSRA